MKRVSLVISLLWYGCAASFSEVLVQDTTGFAPVDLEQVVVTATRTLKKLKDTPVITQVVSGQQIGERGLTNIQDVLQQEVPGLNFQEVGFGTSIDLQGLGAKNILFLVDGERIAGDNSGNIDYQRLNLTNVERIEIVKGASSALYGSQAMGGVINVITKKVRNDVEVSAGAKFAPLFQENYPDNDKDNPQYRFRRHLDKPNLTADLTLGLKKGVISSATTVTYKSSDAYQLFNKKGVTKFFPATGVTKTEDPSTSPTNISGYEDFAVSERLTAEIANRLTLKAYASHYELNKYDFTPDNVFEQTEDWTVGGSAEYRHDDRHSLLASFNRDHYQRYDKYEKIPGRELTYENNISQPRLTYVNTAKDGVTICVGAEHLFEELYGDRFSSERNETRSQWATTFFAQGDWKVNETLSVVGGARADIHEVHGLNVTPKASLMAQTGPLTLRLNYAMGYRTPTLKELYMKWNNQGMFWLIGNPDLKPERNNYVSLSAEVNKGRVSANMNAYANWFSEKIEGIWATGESGMQEYRYTNIGKNRLMGLEVNVRVRAARMLAVHGSYSHLYSSKTDGYQLTATSPNSATFRLEFNSHVPNHETVFNLCGSILGAKDYSVLDAIETFGMTGESAPTMGSDNGAYYDAHTDSYSIWDATLTQNVIKMLSFSIGVNNLFDYKADIVSFNSSVSPGRNFFCSLRLKI